MLRTPVVEKLLSLFRALQTGDVNGLADIIPDATTLHVPGENLLAGAYQGPIAIGSFIGKRHDLAAAKFEPFGEDVSVTEDHGILLYGVKAIRDSQEFISHEILVAGLDGNEIEVLFLYVFERDEFDEFWS